MYKIFLLPLLMGTVSCHSFVPASTAQPGETARVTLGVMRPMSDGTREPMWVEGLVVSSTTATSDAPPTVVLEQRRVEEASQFRSMTHYDTIHVAGEDLQTLEVRRLSWWKTGIGAVLVGAIAYTIYDRFAPHRQEPGR